MHILIVGGSGYLGGLVLPLLARHHTLRVFDRQPPADTSLPYVAGDVCEPGALAGALSGMDALLYMAMGSHHTVGGYDPASITSRASAFDVSVKGLHLALHAAHGAGISHAVYTSSMSVYANNALGRAGADENTPPDAASVYGFTKWLGEEVCRNACAAWGMSANALRLYMPVSEERWQAEAARGATPWTTAEDVARALLVALEYRNGVEAFTISGDYEQKLLNLSKAKRLLGWEPLARPAE